MFSLAYVSDERVAFDTDALGTLGELCSSRNYANAVTGYLSWKGGRFFQYLEGEEATVRALMSDIAADERHSVVRTLELARWEERLFADWDMCFLDSPEPSQTRIQEVVGRLVRTFSAPEFTGMNDVAPIARMIERIAVLARENDPV